MIMRTEDLMLEKTLNVIGNRKYEVANIEMADKIIDCINAKDIDCLNELFSDEVKNSDVDLKGQIQILFGVVEGEIKGRKKNSSEYFWKSADQRIKYDKISLKFDTRYIVDDKKYSFLLEYIFIPKNDFKYEEEGIRRIRFIRDKDRKKYYLRSPDSDSIDMGVYVPAEYYQDK